MTTRRHLIRLGAIGAIPGLGACHGRAGDGHGPSSRRQPIENIQRVGFLGRASAPQRADQIRRAGTRLGWRVEDRGRGLLRGTLNLRDYQAVVDIPYDANTFSIRYFGSTGLDSDGVTIHRSYNTWVDRLQRSIVTAPPG